MKLTIDTNKKEIIVEESTSVSELMGFLLDNDMRYKDYTIVSNHTVTTQKEYDFRWRQYPYNPNWQTELVYCNDKSNNNKSVRTPAGKLTADDISFGNFSKTNL